MIVKKVPNPKMSAPKHVRIPASIKYIAAPTKDGVGEKCIHLMARGFLTDEVVSQTREMLALASGSRSKDPITHYILSFQEGEHPSAQQAEEAVDIFLNQIGMAGHQAVAGLHVDTENHHIHICVNRVHPGTEIVVYPNKGKDLELAHQAVALIEEKQGWKREERGRYSVLADGSLAQHKSRNSATRQPGTKQRDMENATGEKSAMRIAIEAAAPIVRAVTSWEQLHRELAAAGFRYEKAGSGAKIYVGDVAIKASDVDRSASLKKMETRLGQFMPDSSNVAATQHIQDKTAMTGAEAKRTKLATWADAVPAIASAKNWQQLHLELGELGFRYEKTGSGAKMFLGDRSINASDVHRNASLTKMQRRLGPYQESEKLNDSVKVRIVNAVPPIATRVGTADESIAPTSVIRVPKPLKNSALRWHEYLAFKEEHRADRLRQKTAMAARHSEQRAALSARLKAERREFCGQRWKWNMSQLATMRSVIAARHAAMRLDLKDQQSSERGYMATEFSPVPTYEEWLREHGEIEAARRWRMRNKAPQQIEGETYDKPVKRDIRNFEAVVEGDQVNYYQRSNSDGALLGIGFVDVGRQIQINDWRDEGTTLAALQLAAQKFGQFRVFGDDPEYIKMCVRLAAEHGFQIANPELQQAIANERVRVQQLREAARHTPQFKEFERFHAAVGADRYRITTEKTAADGTKELFVIGEGGSLKKGIPTDSVMLRTVELIQYAAQGQEIKYAPMSDRVQHFVVHGVTPEKLRALDQDGFKAACVVRHGDGTHTAVINVRRLSGLDKQAAEDIGAALARKYGGERLTGAVRAPGYFQNEIIRASRLECQKTLEWARAKLAEIESTRSAKRSAGDAGAKPSPRAPLLPLTGDPTLPSSMMLSRIQNPPLPTAGASKKPA